MLGYRDRQIFLNEYFVLGGYSGRQPICERPDRITKLSRYIDACSWGVNLSDIREMP